MRGNGPWGFSTPKPSFPAIEVRTPVGGRRTRKDTGRKSEIQPGEAPKSEPNRPEKLPVRVFRLSTNKGLKASLNPAVLISAVSVM